MLSDFEKTTINIYSVSTTSINDYGTLEPSLTDTTNTFNCSVQKKSGVFKNDNGTISHYSFFRLITSSDPGITLENILKYNGKYYDIENINNVNDMNRVWQIDIRESAKW